MAYWDWDEDLEPAEVRGRRVIGGAIRTARLRRQISQRELGWRSGMTQPTVSKLETGRLRGMRLRTLARLIGVLEAELDVDDPREDASSLRPPRPRRRLPGQDRA